MVNLIAGRSLKFEDSSRRVPENNEHYSSTGIDARLELKRKARERAPSKGPENEFKLERGTEGKLKTKTTKKLLM